MAGLLRNEKERGRHSGREGKRQRGGREGGKERKERGERDRAPETLGSLNVWSDAERFCYRNSERGTVCAHARVHVCARVCLEGVTLKAVPHRRETPNSKYSQHNLLRDT